MSKTETMPQATMGNQPTAYQLAAQVFEEHGIPSFPVQLAQDEKGKWQKKPLVKWGEVTRDTHPGAFNWGGANAVGVPMGSRSGLIALDLDEYKVGSEAAAWAARHDLPATRVHRTTSGGRHLIFRLPEEQDFGNHAPRVSGLDIRGMGGFIVWTDIQGRYSVENDVPPALLPASVCEELQRLQPGSRGDIADSDLPGVEIIDEARIDERLQVLLADPTDRRLGRRFWGNPEGLMDKSRSAMDMSVAGLLANAGFTYSEIVFVLLHRFKHGTAQRDRLSPRTERAVQRCAFRAVRGAEERRERRQAAMRENLQRLCERLKTESGRC